jgi:conjugal transfer mating pair stabilization protein TraG
MSTPTLTVFAYGNVDALHGIFNAIAMVMGSGDFHDMVKVAVIIGFLVVASFALMPNNIARGWYWFMDVALLSGILLVPTATVSIVDKLGMQPPVVVADVPWALALVASVKSSIGATLTNLFETAFQTIPGEMALPAELSYQEHGVMFGNRLVRASREAGFSSLYTQGDTLNFLRNCTFPDLARMPPGSFEHSTSLILTISQPNPALFTPYHDPANGYAMDVAPCPDVYARVISPGMASSAQDALQSLAMTLMPGTPPGVSEPELESSLVAMYGKAALAGASTSAADILTQNILINAVADASALYGVHLNDPSVLMFASMRSQTVAQMNSGYLVQGRIAEEALPILRNILEAVLYALFPVLCILAMTTEGATLARLLKSYLYTMVWIELWPPMDAIVSYLATLASASRLAGAAYMTSASSGVTLQTATGIYSTAISDVAVASWMVTAVPIIAAAILFGVDRIMSVAGAVAASHAADQAAGSATKGNLALDNVSYDQQEMQSFQSDVHVRRILGVGGMRSMNVLTGQSVDTYAQSSGPVSLKDTAGWGNRMAENASIAALSAETHRKAYESSLDAAYNQVLGLIRSGGDAARLATGFDVSRDSADSFGRSEEEKAAARIASEFNISDTSEVAKAIQGSIAVPIFLTKLSANMSSSEKELLSSAIKSAHDTAHARTIERKQSLVDSFRTSDRFDVVRSRDSVASTSVESTMREADGYRQSAAREFATSSRWQEAKEKYQVFARMGESSWGNEFYTFARSHGVDPGHGIASTARLQELLQEFILSGELGKGDDGQLFWVPHQGQGPNIMQGSLDDITPTSLRSRYEHNAPDAGKPGIVRAHQSFDDRVSAAQRAADVSPVQNVESGSVQQAVSDRQAAANDSVSKEQAQMHVDEGRLQQKADERANATSLWHDPIWKTDPITGERIANKALDASRSRTRPFGKESDDVGEADQQLRSQVENGSARIPNK